MEVTDEMLQAAMKAAVRVKILPKLAGVDTYLEHWAGMRKVLEAALDAAPVSNRSDEDLNALKAVADKAAADAVGLLSVARCPDCDGSGVIVRGHAEYVTREMALDAGDEDLEGALYSQPELEPCQWCAVRESLTAPPHAAARN